MELQAVVLAAGYSSRAGAFKMELDLGGRPLLLHTLEAFEGLCSEVFVVTGFEAERIEALLAGKPGVVPVHNPDFPHGMFSSVRVGAARVTAERFFFTPGDCPMISQSVCKALLKIPGEAVVPTCGGRRGHPILLNGACAEEILCEPPESNLRAYLSRKSCTFVELPEEGILRDVDTIEDYRAMRRNFTDARTGVRKE